MSRTHHIREQIATCLEQAARTTDKESREAWLRMAKSWQDLAKDQDDTEPATVQLQQQQVQIKPVVE